MYLYPCVHKLCIVERLLISMMAFCRSYALFYFSCSYFALPFHLHYLYQWWITQKFDALMTVHIFLFMIAITSCISYSPMSLMYKKTLVKRLGSAYVTIDDLDDINYTRKNRIILSFNKYNLLILLHNTQVNKKALHVMSADTIVL